MAMYVVLGQFTAEGIKNVHQLRQNVERNRQSGDRLGTKLHHWFLTMGEYDFVVIAEAPDDETMAAQVLTIGSHGMSHSETLRAFPLDEAEEIIRKIN